MKWRYIVRPPAVMLNYAGNAGDAGDGFIQDVEAAYPLIGSVGDVIRLNYSPAQVRRSS